MTFPATVFNVQEKRCGCCRQRVQPVAEAEGWVHMGPERIKAIVPVCAECAAVIGYLGNGTDHVNR